MPVVLDRLPLPNLTWYSVFSAFLLACSVYYAGVQVKLNPDWQEKYVAYDPLSVALSESTYDAGQQHDYINSLKLKTDKNLHRKDSKDVYKELDDHGTIPKILSNKMVELRPAKIKISQKSKLYLSEPNGRRSPNSDAKEDDKTSRWYDHDQRASSGTSNNINDGHNVNSSKMTKLRTAIGAKKSSQDQDRVKLLKGTCSILEQIERIKPRYSSNLICEPSNNVYKRLSFPHGSDKDIAIDQSVSKMLIKEGKIIATPFLISEIISFMFHEPLCIWTLINVAYCVLILLGTTIQHLVFGELRVSEQQHIKDKFWNFVFYKFIFVFGVMNVQAMDEVVLWCSWFSVLGFLHLLAQLCKDRFEYLSFSPTTPRRTHFRLLGLLSMILLLGSSCLMISFLVGFHAGVNTFAFMSAECVLLMVRTLYVITRYCIYLWDISHEGLWEKRGRYVYWTELTFELSELIIDMVHHIHMLVWGNMLLTMASLVICMQLRMLFYQLQHKLKSHKNYLRVVRLIKRFPEIKSVEVAPEEDTCAICWEVVEIGRQLDCSHLFHSSCLLAWLQHDLSCPTCRCKLSQPEQEEPEVPGILDNLLHSGIEGEEMDMVEGQNGTGTMPSPSSSQGIGWRYVSWLPSFSVEQNHTQLPRHHQVNSQPVATSQLDNLARQVQQMFPDVSYANILEDLHHTRCLEDTIDNILENRLVMPPPMFSEPSDNVSNLHNQEKDFVVEPKGISGGRDSNALPYINIGLLLEEEETTKETPTDTESESELCDTYILGGHFSKCSREREQVLSQRKNSLVSHARQKFLSRRVALPTKLSSSDTVQNKSHSSSSEREKNSLNQSS